MNGIGVLVQLAAAFSAIKAPAFVRRTPKGYEVLVKRTGRVSEAKCFDAFQDVADDLVRDQLIDPTKETIVWLGFVDVVSRDFHQIGSGHG